MSYLSTEPAEHQRPDVYSVSQLNRRARQLLEAHFPLLWVEGEISNISFPASGHWYFVLKDETAQVRCAMFKMRNGLVGFRPKNGQHVLIRCRVGLYENRGDFQLIAEHMEEAGHGALQKQFDALKAKLHGEGLFDEKHKKALPTLPERIGIVTSPTGAAIHDILTVLKRRFPAIPITIYPCPVQGAEAATAIASAIQLANRDNRCDVLIVGRGGGSIEDLWSFNEETVAREIFASKIPVVSAVGHEVDFTIADFVADMRAATPSAAGEILSPDARELHADFNMLRRQLERSLLRAIRSRQQQVDHLYKRLRHPGERLQQNRQRLIFLRSRLDRQMTAEQSLRRSRLNDVVSRLHRNHPSNRLLQYREQNRSLELRLTRAINHLLQQKQARWKNAAQLLNSVSPLQTLGRGYAILTDEQKHVIRKVATVTAGDKISATLTDGELLCRIDEIKLTTENEKI